MAKRHLLILGVALIVAGCKTTPDPVVDPVVVETGPIETCTSISSLEKVIIPAETQTYTAIVLIDNPPYEPIERRETQERVVKEAQVVYVDSEGREVLDICELKETETETPVTEAEAETETETEAPE